MTTSKSNKVVKVVGIGTSKDFNAQLMAALGAKVLAATQKKGK